MWRTMLHVLPRRFGPGSLVLQKRDSQLDLLFTELKVQILDPRPLEPTSLNRILIRAGSRVGIQ